MGERFISELERGKTTAVLAIFLGREFVETRATHGWGPILLLPNWAQVLVVLIVGDFGHYWGHRILHKRLWKFHSIHHAPTNLDWLAATRVHPIDDILGHIFMVVPLFVLGAPLNILAVYVPLLGFVSLLGHANLPWDLGPLRGWIASPRLHRWHHTSEEEGRDKNFAAFFPFWDRVFGTYYMPKDQEPAEFGVDDPVPDGVWGQLKYPFRRS